MQVPEQKKLAYALVCYNAEHSGVYKKILDQVSFWRNAGYSVQLFVITDERSKTHWLNLDPEAQIYLDKNLFSKIKNRFNLLKLAANSNPSLLYLRDGFPMRIPNNQVPIVVEIQSLVGQELKTRSRAKFYLFKWLSKSAYSRVSGAVYVTNELMVHNEHNLNPRIPRITIANGINLARMSKLPKMTHVKPSLFFVGSPNQPWHGVEELVEFGLSNKNVDIHIVGTSSENVGRNIFFHGFLSPEEYSKIAASCNAGVGSLMLSVNEMKEASPLKVREYLALGLPVILKYEDTDFDGDEDYILSLPSDGSSLNEHSLEILEFLDRWSSSRVSRERIQHLDVRNKEETRLKFFKSIISK